MMLGRDDYPLGPHPVSLDWNPPAKSYPGRRGLKQTYRPVHPEVSLPVTLRGSPRSPVSDIGECLETLYELCERPQPNPAIDFVLETMDELILAKDYDTCDRLLLRADVSRLSTHAMLTLLMETFRAKGVLPAREGFYQRVEARLRADQPQRADSLLAGMR
jgi:hypothetical protein